ncbi:MAG: helix-turn-helix domain-containing protein [Pseudomonadota bacterium]
MIASGSNRGVERYRGAERFDYWRDVISDQYVMLDCDGIDRDNVEHFNGTVRRGRALGPVEFSEVIADPQIAIRSKRQIAGSTEDDFLISFQLARSGIVRQSGRSAVLTPGSFALYDSTAPYSLEFESPFHQLVLQMPRDVLTRHMLEPERYTATAITATSGLGFVVQNFIFSLLRELDDRNSPPGEVLAENLVNLIALSVSSTVMTSGLAESDCTREALKRRIMQFIDSNLHDPRLNNTSIARSQGISLRYLHKLFQGEPETIREHVLHRRLALARELLQGPGGDRLSVESVAYRVGFASAAHFSRAFKARFGLCPSSAQGAAARPGSLLRGRSDSGR